MQTKARVPEENIPSYPTGNNGLICPMKDLKEAGVVIAT